MILSILGLRRIFLLTVLALLVVFSANMLYVYIIPKEASTEQSYKILQKKLVQKRKDVELVSRTVEELKTERGNFERLKKNGFFYTQDRIAAGEIIEQLQKLSHVLSVDYKINPAVKESNEKLQTDNYIVLKSPFTMQVMALDDMDLYNFLYLLQVAFPGNISFEKIEIRKIRDVDDVVLKGILSRKYVPTIQCNLEFSWRTIVKDEVLADVKREGEQ